MATVKEHGGSPEPRGGPAASGRTEWRFERFPTGESRFVSAVFGRLEDAREAVRALEERGYPPSQVSLFMIDEVRKRYLRTHPEWEGLDPSAVVMDRVELEKERRTLEGAGVGGVIGGAVGAVAAAVAAIGTTLVVPGLGLVVAGPVAAAFAGAGAGGTVGGIVGALTGAGMSEYRARRFERLLKEGEIIVGGHARTKPELHLLREALVAEGGVLVADAVDGTDGPAKT